MLIILLINEWEVNSGIFYDDIHFRYENSKILLNNGLFDSDYLTFNNVVLQPFLENDSGIINKYRVVLLFIDCFSPDSKPDSLTPYTTDNHSTPHQ